MKVMMQTWLCNKHTDELRSKLAHKSDCLIWDYHGAIPCQEKRCGASAEYKVYVWTEIRRRKL